jgi:hypothetical protein
MQTITLQVQDKIYDKFLWFISHFSSQEINVVKQPKKIVDNKNSYDNSALLKNGLDPDLISREEKLKIFHEMTSMNYDIQKDATIQ